MPVVAGRLDESLVVLIRNIMNYCIIIITIFVVIDNNQITFLRKFQY